ASLRADARQDSLLDRARHIRVTTRPPTAAHRRQRMETRLEVEVRPQRRAEITCTTGTAISASTAYRRPIRMSGRSTARRPRLPQPPGVHRVLAVGRTSAREVRILDIGAGLCSLSTTGRPTAAHVQRGPATRSSLEST